MGTRTERVRERQERAVAPEQGLEGACDRPDERARGRRQRTGREHGKGEGSRRTGVPRRRPARRSNCGSSGQAGRRARPRRRAGWRRATSRAGGRSPTRLRATGRLAGCSVVRGQAGLSGWVSSWGQELAPSGRPRTDAPVAAVLEQRRLLAKPDRLVGAAGGELKRHGGQEQRGSGQRRRRRRGGRWAGRSSPSEGGQAQPAATRANENQVGAAACVRHRAGARPAASQLAPVVDP